MSLLPNITPSSGLKATSPVQRPDRVPLEKGEYSVASRALALSSYFLSGALAINLSQFLGAPLYLVNQDWYNAWIAFTKQSFGLLTMTLTQAFAPTKVVVSGDASVRGQLSKSADGNLILDFPKRLILMANHQIYTDWLYLWWIAYCNGMHGRLYIILKESLKRIPVLGWGMQMSQFIFLKRNWEKDRPEMANALQKLNKASEAMWLLLFPEGTNLAPSTREKSAKWAKKTGIPDPRHVLLPRTTGLQFCLEELKGTVDYLYDCTVAYEGVPRGQFAQDVFTLKAGYLEGRPPKSVHMHWRRFAVKDIPIHNQKAFELWLIARWREKDVLIENYLRTGKFPADAGATKYKSGRIARGAGHLEVQIRSSHWYEFLQIFAPMGVLAMVIAVFYGALPQSFWKSFNKEALHSSTQDIKHASIQAGTQAKALSNSATGLTLDDIFDRDKQGDSFKKGALAVQQWLNTPQAQTLMNRVDFVSQFLQNPQQTVAETMKGQRKDFMRAVEEEEQRRRQLKMPDSTKNVGPQKGTFWEDLEKLENSRHGSVVSGPSSKPTGTFWANLKAAEQKRTGMEYGARGTFWDKVKAEQNSRFGTVRTLSSSASTTPTLKTLSSTTTGTMKSPPSTTTVSRRPSVPAKLPPAPPATNKALTSNALRKPSNASGKQKVPPNPPNTNVPSAKPLSTKVPASSASTNAAVPRKKVVDQPQNATKATSSVKPAPTLSNVTSTTNGAPRKLAQKFSAAPVKTASSPSKPNMPTQENFAAPKKLAPQAVTQASPAQQTNSKPKAAPPAAKPKSLPAKLPQQSKG